jgi:DNA-binding LacI/PurR family transcriptional regulator
MSTDGAQRTPAARLSDVAALAHVSISTASRALGGDPRISTPTRRRVERAARHLAYRVNPLARGLSLRRTFTVGLLVGDLTNPFFAELARGVDHALQEVGYTHLLADMAGDARRQRELAQRMVDRHVDGLLATVPHDAETLASLPVPVVAIDRCPGLPWVSSDNVEGGRLAARHLAEAGYRRIAVLHAEPGLAPVHDRREGFLRGLAEAGLPLDPALDGAAASLLYDDAHARAKELLAAGADAVFAVDDVMAAAVIAAAIDLGLSVPEQVGVVGCDNTPMAAWGTLSLTSIDQRTQEMGRLAASMLLRRIERSDEDVPSITLEPRLVVRRSSAGPAGPQGREGARSLKR